MRARMAIAYANEDTSKGQKVTVELREVSLREKPPELVSISPKGTVPVLQLPNGQVVEESIEIMDWALSQSDVAALGQIQNNEIGQDLIHENDNEFKRWLDRYKYADRYPEYTFEHSRDRAERFLKKLEALLGRGSYLQGDSLSVIDLAIFPFVRQFAMVDMQWFEQSEYVLLRKWLEALMTSEKFLSIMEKYPLWAAESQPITFPKTNAV